MDQQNLSAWIGREEIHTGHLGPELAAMLHATLGHPGRCAPEAGDALPPLWHWCAFPPTAGMSELGADGHPRLGGFLPPVRLDRRMWAGGALTFHAPLHVGEPLVRRSSIRSVTEKDGAAGPMVLVTLYHEIISSDGLAVSEQQDIVYLQIPDRFVPPRKLPAPEEVDLDECVPITEMLLFRYSAVTFNAHRIHYDLPYAKGVEHYPGLVVHGPLQASLLIQAATRHHGNAPLSFRFRGIHPMFHFEDLRLLGVEEGPDTLALCTASPAGHQGLQAAATWEDVTT